jgi:hypothetical protein
LGKLLGFAFWARIKGEGCGGGVEVGRGVQLASGGIEFVDSGGVGGGGRFGDDRFEQDDFGHVFFVLPNITRLIFRSGGPFAFAGPVVRVIKVVNNYFRLM